MKLMTFNEKEVILYHQKQVSLRNIKREINRVLSLSEYLEYMSAALQNSTEFFLNIVNGNFNIVSGPKFRKYSNLLFPMIIIAYIISPQDLPSSTS